MRSKKLLYLVAILIFFIFFINLLAMKFFWYFSVSWFDMVMHFLGGLWVSLAAFYILKPNSPWLSGILSVLIIGVLWEIFEFSLDTFITFKKWDIVDTLSDLVFDFLGALAGILFFYVKIKKWQKN